MSERKGKIVVNREEKGGRGGERGKVRSGGGGEKVYHPVH